MFASVARRWRKGPMSELIIPLATKVLLSGVLVLLAIIFARQAWQIWFNRSLVLAPFDFLEAGKPSAQAGEQYSRMVGADLKVLADLYNVGEVANDAAVVGSNQGGPIVPMDIPVEFDTSFFEGIELKAYGIEFGTIIKSLRRKIESPSEITGSVTHQNANYSVFAELKRPDAGADSLQRWSIQYAADLPDATRKLACRIFRSLATSSQSNTPDADLFRAIDDEDFCLFSRALAAYDQYWRRKATISEAEATELLAEADRPLANLLNRESVDFPYVPKLAALVFYEQGKFVEAESAIERYKTWLDANGKEDAAAVILRSKIRSGKLQKTPATSRQRPVHPGSSVGLIEGETAGMICCLLKDAEGHRYLLSAAPVFGSTTGAKIVQPAVRDGGTENDVVANVHKVTTTMAIASLRTGVDSDPRVLELGGITGIETTPSPGQDVVTYGFDGERRAGKVVSTGVTRDVPIDSESGMKIHVENATITSKISSGGEIGAPVLTPEGKLIGMIFASGGPSTMVLPVEPVLNELGLELAK